MQWLVERGDFDQLPWKEFICLRFAAAPGQRGKPAGLAEETWEEVFAYRVCLSSFLSGFLGCFFFGFLFFGFFVFFVFF